MKKLATIALALLAACGTTGEAPPPVQETALTMLRVVGDAALRVKGYAELQRSAPAAVVAMVDADSDKVLTLAECETFLRSAFASPENAAALLAFAYLMHESK
jgi:hypothetical protein